MNPRPDQQTIIDSIMKLLLAVPPQTCAEDDEALRAPVTHYVMTRSRLASLYRVRETLLDIDEGFIPDPQLDQAIEQTEDQEGEVISLIVSVLRRIYQMKGLPK